MDQKPSKNKKRENPDSAGCQTSNKAATNHDVALAIGRGFSSIKEQQSYNSADDPKAIPNHNVVRTDKQLKAVWLPRMIGASTNVPAELFWCSSGKDKRWLTMFDAAAEYKSFGIIVEQVGQVHVYSPHSTLKGSPSDTCFLHKLCLVNYFNDGRFENPKLSNRFLTDSLSNSLECQNGAKVRFIKNKETTSIGSTTTKQVIITTRNEVHSFVRNRSKKEARRLHAEENE
jgi:hypothetical protein